jgi:L-amino acid N-acyltransferase YncA
MDRPIAIRPMLESDWPAVARIYREGIQTGLATFETEVPDWNDWDIGHHRRCRLVADVDGQVVAWAALGPVSRRHVYRGVAELSIYVAEQSRGNGVGSRLLAAVVSESETEGFWTVQAGIFPENEASIRLHERLGFRIVGVRERIGELDGVWRDVVFMERRSSST